MISKDVIEAAAARLRDAQTQGVPCEPVRTLIGDTDIAAAYQVQQINNALRVAQGGVVVGQKIGLTSHHWLYKSSWAWINPILGCCSQTLK